MKYIAGIEKKNRNYLEILNREFNAPFTINEAVNTLGFDYKKTKRFLAYLASRGWLARVKNGYYKTVPLSIINPFELKEDPWILATKIYSPCYIGGFSACQYWDLTEQIFKDTVVFTERKITGKILPGYILKIIKDEKFFGLSNAWINNIKVNVSDPTRTIIDLLNDPIIGGGIRHTADVIFNYFSSEHKNEELLLKYLEMFDSGVLYKRLGYIMEVFEIKAENILSECLKRKTKGFTLLDPSIKLKGKYNNRWNLIVNAIIKKENK